MAEQNDNTKNKFKVGKDSVVIGNVSPNADIGDGSVVIGATDANGNTIINTPMAVGRGAFAGPGSIAIGAGAGAGSEIGIILSQLNEVIKNTNDPELIRSFSFFVSEIHSPKPDKSLLKKLWDRIKVAATLDGVIGLTSKVSAFLATL
jgi:hypothetical protein